MDSPDSHPMVEPLSDRERDILLLIAEGLSNFWKGVSGEEKIPDRNIIQREPIKGS